MPQGDKGKYTSKQKRKAAHIEKSYESKGTSSGEAARRAWATVNKESGGGKKAGSGRGRSENHSASRRGGKRSHAGSSARSSGTKSRSSSKRFGKSKR